MIRLPILMLLLACIATPTLAAPETPNAPWGRAQAIEKEYRKQKVVYDVATDSEKNLNRILDRASFLSQINGADPFENKIVLVLHGNEIPFFGIKNHAKYKALMQRAQSLSLDGIIEFRMCQVAARGHGFKPEDIHGFVNIVPMADAEIIELQSKGFAYMR